MKIILFIMSFLSSLFGSSPAQNDTITILDKAAFSDAISNKNVQLVDVRTPQEYQEGYIAHAINIDFFKQDDFVTKFNKLNKDEAVYVYCRSGNRSQKAARKLDSLGFKKIYDLKGGYLNW